MREVVGLDPSLRASGVALPDGSLMTIRNASASTLPDRVERLRRILGEVGHAVGTGRLVVIEGPAFGMGNKATHELGGLWWALCVRLAELGNQLVVVTPTQLKKLATGKGNATKADMRVSWLRRTGQDIADDNQADAAWLRQAGLHLVGSLDAVPLPKVHLEALALVELPEGVR